MASRNLDFRKSIIPILESIDAIQSTAGKPLHLRPFDAADLVVRHFIVKVEGDDDKNNYLDKPWFAAMYAEVHKWYESKYGSLDNAQGDSAIGLIVHAGLPHTIHIPRTISAIQESGLVKLTFPSKLSPNETPVAWIKPKIRMRSLRVRVRNKLTNRVSSICNSIRLININTSSSGGKNSKVPLMAGSVVEHLSKAAATASSDHKKNSLALWDIHLACEKSIKSLLSQRGISFPNIHDLSKLNKLLSNPPIERKASALIRRMPSHKSVIKHRYLEEVTISPNRLYSVYSLALRLCVLYTSDLTQPVRIADASFYIKRPPWFSQLD